MIRGPGQVYIDDTLQYYIVDMQEKLLYQDTTRILSSWKN